MSLLLQDIKYALRRLSRAPVFSSFAIAILAIGIGLNVTVFGVVDALLFRPAPFTDPERIVHIYQDSDSGVPAATAYPAYRDIAAMTDVFAAVARDEVECRHLGDARWAAPGVGRFCNVELLPGARSLALAWPLVRRRE